MRLLEVSRILLASGSPDIPVGQVVGKAWMMPSISFAAMLRWRDRRLGIAPAYFLHEASHE